MLTVWQKKFVCFSIPGEVFNLEQELKQVEQIFKFYKQLNIRRNKL